MSGDNYDCSPTPTTATSRLERLLRERALRKSNRHSQPVKEKSNEHSQTVEETKDSNKELELHSDLCSSKNDIREEELSENLADARLTESQRKDEQPTKQRLLVVANRLPVSATRKGVDSWQLEISAGGLVSAILGVKEFDIRWIGWAGLNVQDEVGQNSLTEALAEKRCIPVFLDEDIVRQYYNGYCNNILWPLFHYLGLPEEDELATTRTFQSQFDAYKIANQMFADVVYKQYKEGDVVWCHDYHLMFLPKCLKERDEKMKIGWFLHTPFPSSEIHRTLPSRTELLRSVLAADLVGFHTYDYARHFVSACTRILGLEGTPEGVEDHGKLIRVAAFPVGIDSERFVRALDLPQVQDQMKVLKEQHGDRKIMLGVDRLDMIKGIPRKILAFEKFLEENPDWRDKVVLIQIAVPTRTDVPRYKELAKRVHKIVGRVNGRFGTLGVVPMHHLDQSLDFHTLCALYAIADVALVTSSRDGMNLVSYEYVACQASKKGVLILSEFAGAAQSLGAGAILVNPWNITEVAASIAYALNMPADEIEKRHQLNFKHVTTHTSQEWAATFVSELNDTTVEAQLRTRQVPPLLPKQNAVDCYLKSKNRLIILGFNATLTEPGDALGNGGQVKEMELKLHPNVKDPLKKLSDDPKTTIVVLSGSDRDVLDKNFSGYNMWLAAENGMFLRHSTTGEWMTTMPENINIDWVDSVKQVFEYFTERTPRSQFDLRESSMVWNYKYSDVEFGRLQARDLLQHLWTGPISNASLDVVQGGRTVEVRAVGVSKGAAIDRILAEIIHQKAMKTPIDYVLCVGHFLPKDEDVYAFFEPDLPPESSSHVPKFSSSKSSSVSKAARLKKQRSLSTSERRKMEQAIGIPAGRPTLSHRDRVSLKEGSSVVDLKGDNYFSCTVAQKTSSARYLLKTSDHVVQLLKELADQLEE